VSALRPVDGLEVASRLERILGRPERPLPLDEPLARLAGKRILITGAQGSIGSALLEHVDATEMAESVYAAVGFRDLGLILEYAPPG